MVYICGVKSINSTDTAQATQLMPSLERCHALVHINNPFMNDISSKTTALVIMSFRDETTKKRMCLGQFTFSYYLCKIIIIIINKKSVLGLNTVPAFLWVILYRLVIGKKSLLQSAPVPWDCWPQSNSFCNPISPVLQGGCNNRDPGGLAFRVSHNSHQAHSLSHSDRRISSPAFPVLSTRGSSINNSEAAKSTCSNQ